MNGADGDAWSRDLEMSARLESRRRGQSTTDTNEAGGEWMEEERCDAMRCDTDTARGDAMR